MCLCVCVSVCISLRVCVCVCLCICVCLGVCLCVCLCVWVHPGMCLGVSGCIYVCLCIWVHLGVSGCICACLGVCLGVSGSVRLPMFCALLKILPLGAPPARFRRLSNDAHTPSPELLSATSPLRPPHKWSPQDGSILRQSPGGSHGGNVQEM